MYPPYKMMPSLDAITELIAPKFLLFRSIPLLIVMVIGGCIPTETDESQGGQNVEVRTGNLSTCSDTPTGRGACYDYDWAANSNRPSHLAECDDPSKCDALPTEESAELGAVEGSFDVTPTGEAVYSIPLEVPPGRKGMAPALTLSYNSAQSDGLMGVGWSLTGLPSIKRCNQGVGANLLFEDIAYPVDLGSADQLCLGGEELVPIQDQNGEFAHYRLRNDVFMKVEKVSGGYVAYHKNGQIWKFGEFPSGDESCIESSSTVCKGIAVGNSSSTITNGIPVVSAKAKEWLLTRVYDRWGNFINVAYEHEVTGMDTLESRPLEITYTGLTYEDGSGGVVQKPGTRSIVFSYEARQDTDSQGITRDLSIHGYKDGEELQRSKVLSAVTTRVDDEIVLEYHLGYSYRTSLNTDKYHEPVPTLGSVQVCDSNGVCKEPTRFEWEGNEIAPSVAPYTSESTLQMQVIGPDGEGPVRPVGRPMYVDVDGDGRTDILFRPYQNGKGPISDAYYLVWGAQLLDAFEGQATHVEAVVASGLPSTVPLMPFDHNADGLVDFLERGDVTRAFRNLGDGSFVRESSSIGGVKGNEIPITVMNAETSSSLLANLVVCDPDTNSIDYFEHSVQEPHVFSRHELTPTLGCDQMPDLLQVDRNGSGASSILYPYGFDKDNNPDLGAYPQHFGVLKNPRGDGMSNQTNIRAVVGADPPYSIKVLDYNGDGLQDVLKAFFYEEGFKEAPRIEAWLNTGREFKSIGVVYEPTVPEEFSIFFGLELEYGSRDVSDFKTRWDSAIVTDLDGNGRDDLIVPKVDSYYCSGSKPADCSPTATGRIGEWVALMAGIRVTVNGTYDGYHLTRLAYRDGDAEGSPIIPYEPFYLSSAPPMHSLEYQGALWQAVAAVDIDASGKPDLVHWYWEDWDDFGLQVNFFSHPRKQPKIVKIREGNLGVKSSSPQWNDTWSYSIDYSRMTNAEHFASSGGIFGKCANGPCMYDFIPGKRFVSSYQERTGSWTAPLRYSFEYGPPIVDMKGKGFLGFESRTTTRLPDGRKVYEEYNYDYNSTLKAYPWLGRVSKRIVTQPDGQGETRRSTETKSFEVMQTAQPSGKALAPYFAYARDTAWEVEHEVNGRYWLLRAGYQKLRSPDSFGNFETTITRNGWNEVQVDAEYHNDPQSWLIGRPERLRTEYTNHAGSPYGTDRTLEFEYGSVNARGVDDLRRVIREPDSTAALAGVAAERVDVELTYDNWGNIIKKSGADAFGNQRVVFERSFDSDGYFPEWIKNGEGHQTDQVFSPSFGNLLIESDPNGLTTRWAYDGFGRQVRTVQPDGTQLVTARHTLDDAQGLERTVVHQTRSDSADWSATVFDEFGRPLKDYSFVFGGRTSHVEYTYDVFGRLASKTRPAFDGDTAPGAATTEWDNLGRPIFKRDANGEVTSFHYELGQSSLDSSLMNVEATITDPNQHSRTIVRDASGRIRETIDELGNKTTFEYGPLGYPLRVTDPAGNVTTSYFDRFGRRERLEDPDLGVRINQYNGFGDLVSTQMPGTSEKSDDLEVKYEYDDIGRIKSRESFRGGVSTGVSTWLYDPSGAIGLLDTQVSEDGHIKAFKYDNFGRVSTIDEEIDGTRYSQSYHYDSYGRLGAIEYPRSYDGTPFVIEFQRDQYGMIERLYDAVSQRTYAKYSSANPAGQFTQVEYGNGVLTTTAYEQLTGRVQSISSYSLNQAQSVQTLEYGYDPEGNTTFRRDDIANQIEWFSYDDLDRLIGWQTGEECSGSCPIKVEYDRLGNIEFMDGVGTYWYETTQPHAVTKITDGNGYPVAEYSYDVFGNQRERPEWAIEYTNFDKPKTIENTQEPIQIEYRYSATFDRVGRETSAERTHFVGSLYERTLDKDTGETRDIYYLQAAGGATVSVTREARNEEVRYLHKDHLGSVDVVTDSTGEVVENRSYRPFGQPRSEDWEADEPISIDGSGVRVGYTGHRHEEDGLGLIYTGARLYDPHIGRFLSPDALVSEPFHSQSRNRYSYVSNNPLRYIDPSGFQQCDPLEPTCNDSGWWLVPGDPEGWRNAARKVKRAAKNAGEALEDTGEAIDEAFEDLGNALYGDGPGSLSYNLSRANRFFSGAGHQLYGYGDYFFNSSPGIQTCKTMAPGAVCHGVGPLVTIGGGLGEQGASIYMEYNENGLASAANLAHDQIFVPPVRAVETTVNGVFYEEDFKAGEAAVDVGIGFFALRGLARGSGARFFSGRAVSWRTFKFRGSIRRRRLRTATHHEIDTAFRKAGFEPSNHFIMRVKHPRTEAMGFRTFKDLENIFRKGEDLAGDSPGTAVKLYREMAVIYDTQTQRLISLRPYKK